MARSPQSVQGVQGFVQGSATPLHTDLPLNHAGLRAVCMVCRGSLAGVRGYAPTHRAPVRATRECDSRAYAPLHTLHTLHKSIVVRVSAVQGSKNALHTLHTFQKGTIPMASLRDEMPQTAEWIDTLRAVFGADGINQQIKAGLNGQPTFWARENGREVGTKDQRQGVVPTAYPKIEQAPDFAKQRGRK